jgi:hypothetical protein
MRTDARLISYTPLVGVDGSGEPRFGVNIVAALMPACQVGEPSRRRQDDAAADQVRADLLVTLPRRVFEAAGRLPATGDRVVVKPDAWMAEPRVGDVLAFTESGGLIRLELSERVDLRGGVGGGGA